MTDQESVRLNKYLALQLGISRREADSLIEQKQVTINGQVAQLGAQANTADIIQVRGTMVTPSAKLTYIALNKPVGYVSSRRAQGNNPTIYSLLPVSLHHLKSVGRLDKDSSGLLFLTNDGDFAFRMTHPKFRKIKIYKIRLDRQLEPLHQQMISDYGVQLEDGPSKLSLERLHDDNRKEWQVTMSEGRNRQIRRTFAALGYTVTKLHRIQFGNYSLSDMKTGQYKFVDIR